MTGPARMASVPIAPIALAICACSVSSEFTSPFGRQSLSSVEEAHNGQLAAGQVPLTFALVTSHYDAIISAFFLSLPFVECPSCSCMQSTNQLTEPTGRPSPLSWLAQYIRWTCYCGDLFTPI